jgi:hypothetical protein
MLRRKDWCGRAEAFEGKAEKCFEQEDEAGSHKDAAHHAKRRESEKGRMDAPIAEQPGDVARNRSGSKEKKNGRSDERDCARSAASGVCTFDFHELPPFPASI